MTELEKHVRRRAHYRCEYCQLPQSASRLRHQVDHIIARQHGGSNAVSNRAFCCVRCNLRKGPNVAGIDRLTGEVVRLYNPRLDRWREHFAWQGPTLVGLTATGRVTINVLAINESDMVAVREALVSEGRFPPR